LCGRKERGGGKHKGGGGVFTQGKRENGGGIRKRLPGDATLRNERKNEEITKRSEK